MTTTSPVATTTAKIEKKFYLSKKWWAAAVGAVIPILNLIPDVDLKPAELMTIISPILTYILAQGLADFKKNA